MNKPQLSESVELNVRFSEVDSMEVVWHGNYFKYFEEAREAFGRKYEVGYQDVKAQMLRVPVVHAEIDYKQPLTYGDRFKVTARYEDAAAAKIIFHYTIHRLSDQMLIAKGKTIQVFTDQNGDLQLLVPEFFRRWKARWF